MSTTISVITVSYNSSKTISRTFDYMLLQSLPPMEYLVIDGASSDTTVDIIKSYEPKFKDKGINFKWISEKDNGIYDAMNKGIRLAQGDLIGIINSDDHYMPWTINTVTEVADENPDVDVYHGLLRHTANGKLSRITGLPSWQLASNMIEHPTCFVKKSTYERYGAFNLSYRYVADYELMLRLKKAGCKFYLIEKVLADFEENGAGNSSASRKEALRLQLSEGLIDRKQYTLLRIKDKIHSLLNR